MDPFSFLFLILLFYSGIASLLFSSLLVSLAIWAVNDFSLRSYPTVVLLLRMVGWVVFHNMSFTMVLICLLYIKLRCRMGGIRTVIACMHARTGISSRADWQRLGSKPKVTEFVTNNMKRSFASRVLSAVCPSWHAINYKINKDGTITIHMGFDSCANVHYVGDKRLLRNYRSHRGLSVDGLGGNSHVRGIGDLPLAITCTDGSVQHIVLPDVFYIENNTACILSSFLFLDQCRELVHRVEMTRKKSSIECNDGSKFELLRSDDLLVLPVDVTLGKSADASRKRVRRSDLRGADGSPVVRSSSFESSRGSSVDVNYAHLLLCHAGKDKL